MRELNNTDIIIKPADKGGSIIIMNTTDYIQEAQRQLLNPQHYILLTSDPTTTYNKYIHHIIDQALEIRNYWLNHQRKPTNKESKDIYFSHAIKNTQTRQPRKTNSK